MIPRKQVMATTRNTFPASSSHHLKEDRNSNLYHGEDEHTGRLSHSNNCP